MEIIQVFNDELNSLLETKPPVSKAKMGLITRAAMKGVKFYKHIVHSTEKFIARCRPEYKVPGLYVIDSIVRQSRHQFGIDRDVYAARFSRNLQMTFNNLFNGCLSDDRPKIVRVLNLWQKNGVFNSQTIQPLLDMANPNSSLTLATESTLSADSPNELSKINPKYMMHHYNNAANSSNSQYQQNSSSSSKHHGQENLKFSKSMLDFDYDEDDDEDGDETPTEAEPPLSSTLSKIEMEQRGLNDSSTSMNSSSHQAHHSHQNRHKQANKTRNEQDPVLERWNKLFKTQSDVDEITGDSNKKVRDRSRSPPSREEIVQTATKSSSEKNEERKAERLRKCLPEIRDKHLTVCSSTLWLGHVPKTVSEADISDAFGEFGAITSIDLIPPRGCAYVCMDRRQDAKRALSESKDLLLNGSHVKMAWAPGKGFKEYKKLKDFWEVDIGCSYIPYSKIDETIDFDVLEEGGVIDEDSMSMEMRDRREKKLKGKEVASNQGQQPIPSMNIPIPALPILTHPPPSFQMPPPNLSIPPPNMLGSGSVMRGIPFPPPNIVATKGQLNQSLTSKNLYANQESEKKDILESPSLNSIDQHISMTEQQISIVESQLSMMQHAQNLAQRSQSSALHQPAPVFQTSQAPNPMIFDLSQTSLLHGVPSMAPLLDPNQIPIFANQTSLLGQGAPTVPMNQAGFDPGMNGNHMPHYDGRY